MNILTCDFVCNLLNDTGISQAKMKSLDDGEK